MDDFIVKSIIAGVGVSMVAGVLGCFIVWRRMAYFGDSLAHSALLGIALGMIVGININIGIIIIAVIFAILLNYMEHQQILSTDTLLGIMAHGSLATGLVLISFFTKQEIDLHDFLFGDILTVKIKEIYWIYAGVLLVYFLVIKNWQKLILLTINKDLAGAQGINCVLLQLILTFLVTIAVAISIKIIGVLLITSMLIIPAATARQLSVSPIQMCVLSVLFGVLSVICGILMTYHLDTPSGPSIVFSGVIGFITIFAIRSKKFNS